MTAGSPEGSRLAQSKSSARGGRLPGGESPRANKKGEAVLKRMFGLIVSFLAAIVLVAIAVANRHDVALVLDPFRPEAPALQLVLPFYMHIIGALIAGVLLGGAATWVTQGRWRRSSRRSLDDAKRWRTEADRLMRERDANLMAGSAGSSKSVSVRPASRRTAA